MVQKTKIGLKIKSHSRTRTVILAKGHNSPAVRAKELLKPSKDAESRVVKNKKN